MAKAPALSSHAKHTDSWFTEHEGKIEELAAKHGKTVPFIRRLLCNTVRYAPKRGVNLRNAIVHDRSLKAKEEGDNSASLSAAERERLITQLTEYRDLQDQGAQATNKAAALDALQTANRVGEVMIDLFERTNVRAIGLFMRGNPDDSAVPYIVDSDYSRAFFKEVMKWDYTDLLRKFEQWACTRDSGEHECNDLNSVRKEIAQIILDTLCLKNNQKLLMDYVNYLVVIVHGLGVRLAGWPDSIAMVRPSKLCADDARIIRAKLRSGAIKWVVLSKRERVAVAEEVDALREQGPLRSQKERSDKGSKRGPYKKRGAKGGDDSDDESDDNHEESPSSALSSSTSSALPAASASTASASTAASVSIALGLPSRSASSVSAPPAASTSSVSAPPAASASPVPARPAASTSAASTLPAATPSVALPAAFVPHPAEQVGLLGSISSSYYDPYAVDYDDLNFGLMGLQPLPSGEPLIPSSWDLMMDPNGPLHSMDNEARGSDTASLRLNTSNVDMDIIPVASSSSAQAPIAQTIPRARIQACRQPGTRADAGGGTRKFSNQSHGLWAVLERT
ncbi:hypothetical protein K438DRAFT_1983164 [Mycena galopus ATCC 62051]|nr:hypothetical protein K438DRAFT_1983164 [Mycena galopus ATCC 62051]